VKDIGDPVTPARVAVTVFVPAEVPVVQEVKVATPAPLVVTVEGRTDPPPAVTANVTSDPETGLPAESTIFMDGAVAAAPAVTVCVVTLSAVMVAAFPEDRTVPSEGFAVVKVVPAEFVPLNANVLVPVSPVIASPLNVAAPVDDVVAVELLRVPAPLAKVAVTVRPDAVEFEASIVLL
jgi:hypothetical protein